MICYVFLAIFLNSLSVLSSVMHMAHNKDKLLMPRLCRSIPIDCNVPMGDRKNCGYPGITAQKCEENMNCCFGAAAHGPWCYYGKT